MTNKRVDVNEFGACAKKMFGTLDVTKANMEAISATYNVCIPSKVKYAEVVSSDPIVRRIPVTEEVEAPERISATTAIEPLTDTELSEHQKAVSVTSIVAEAERTSSILRGQGDAQKNNILGSAYEIDNEQSIEFSFNICSTSSITIDFFSALL